VSAEVKIEGAEIKKRSFLRANSAVIIFFLTGLAYAIAFGYEAGYLDYFSIPAEFAEVGLQSLLVCAVVTSTGALLLFFMLNMLALQMPARFSDTLQKEIASTLVLLIPVAFAIWWGQLFLVLGIALLILVMLLNIFVAPIRQYHSLRGYWEKVEAAAAQRVKTAVWYGSLGLAKYFDARVVLVVFLVALSPFFAYELGGYEASDQDAFLVPKDGPTCVVLRVRKEGLLCATYIPKDRVACGEYHFLKAEGITLEFSRTGRLGRWGPACGLNATAPPAGLGKPTGQAPPNQAESKPAAQ
jgi:hypothetical protein